MERINGSPPVISITPSDSTVFTPALIGLRIGGAGDVVVRSGSADVTITNVQAGETLPGSYNQVLSTGTTATDIIGWQWKEGS